jgi:hypothetical protein
MSNRGYNTLAYRSFRLVRVTKFRRPEWLGHISSSLSLLLKTLSVSRIYSLDERTINNYGAVSGRGELSSQKTLF